MRTETDKYTNRTDRKGKSKQTDTDMDIGHV